MLRLSTTFPAATEAISVESVAELGNVLGEASLLGDQHGVTGTVDRDSKVKPVMLERNMIELYGGTRQAGFKRRYGTCYALSGRLKMFR